MQTGTLYVDEGEKIPSSNYVALVQFEDGEINNHSYTNYTYEDVFNAIMKYYKSVENEKQVLRILIEKK